MALTKSTILELGSTAPDFTLPSTDGGLVSFIDVKGTTATVVLFICNHCPYVIHIAPTLAIMARDYMARGIGFAAINSNDIAAYPMDDFDHMKLEKQHRGYPFHYMLDETQEVAKAYSAACTPDIYLFNAQDKLVYHGQFDDTRPDRISSGNYDSSRSPAHGADLKKALDKLLSKRTPDPNQTPCMGCNIKWKPGNEPEYFG